MNNNFSNYIIWSERDTLENINYPGVYEIAISNAPLNKFELSKEIVYFGMTNAIKGLKSRLTAFYKTIT